MSGRLTGALGVVFSKELVDAFSNVDRKHVRTITGDYSHNTQRGSRDSLLIRALDLLSKGCEFESCGAAGEFFLQS